MGLLKNLFRTGATVAATVAAVKVAEKYKENNPDGVQDVNGDGKVDVKDVLCEVKKAGKEVYDSASAAVAQKMNGAAQTGAAQPVVEVPPEEPKV